MYKKSYCHFCNCEASKYDNYNNFNFTGKNYCIKCKKCEATIIYENNVISLFTFFIQYNNDRYTVYWSIENNITEITLPFQEKPVFSIIGQQLTPQNIQQKLQMIFTFQ